MALMRKFKDNLIAFCFTMGYLINHFCDRKKDMFLGQVSSFAPEIRDEPFSWKLNFGICVFVLAKEFI